MESVFIAFEGDQHFRNNGLTVQWVIYDHPSDHPNAYVARRWLIGPGAVNHTATVLLSDDLKNLRDAFARFGYTCLPRSMEDDPVIIETWI